MPKKKNYIISLVLAVIFWLVWGFVFFLIPPDSYVSHLTFFVSLFLSLFLTFALLLANSRRGLLISLLINFYLIFRYFNLNNIIYPLILLFIFLLLEIYFVIDKKDKP